MNWRRGLLLAAIHLAVAASVLIWQESWSWRHIKSGLLDPMPAHLELAADKEGEAISFNPCEEGEGWYPHPSPPEKIVEAANLPVALLTGWHEACTLPGPLDSMVEKRLHRTRTSEIVILAILCVLVALQWFLAGGFPLIRPRRWWLEPGAFIALCTLAGAALALIPYVDLASVILAWVIILAWLWWFGLLVWKTSRALWLLAARGIAHIR